MCTSRLDSEDVLAMSLVGAFALLPRRKCSGVLGEALVDSRDLLRTGLVDAGRASGVANCPRCSIFYSVEGIRVVY